MNNILKTLSFQLSWPTAVVCGVIVTACVLWFLIRVKYKKIYFPIVKIIHKKDRTLPKLSVKIPPLIPFLMFLISCLILVFVHLEPSYYVATGDKKINNKYHVLFDLSPSVEASSSIEDYKNTSKQLLNDLISTGVVSVSTTSSDKVELVATTGDVQGFLNNLTYHRAGVKLGNVVTQQLKGIAEINKLFVVSDRDGYSWSDFNWKYFAGKLDVVWVPVADQSSLANVFIKSVDFMSSSSTQQVEWSVQIQQNLSTSATTNGTIEVLYLNKVLATKEWSIPLGATTINVNISYQMPSNTVSTDSDVKLQYLTFQVKTQNNHLTSDDKYGVVFRGSKQNAFVIAAPSGEMQLEDSAHYVQTVLNLYGFVSIRVDMISSSTSHSLSAYPLWIVVGGGINQTVDSFCPSVSAANTVNKTSKSDGLSVVWLAPDRLQADYSTLCWCFSNLSMSNEGSTSKKPKFCENIVDRDRYIEVLSALGAKQIGGELDDSTTSVALSYESAKTKSKIAAWTVPLRPLKSTGIGHGKFPILVSYLLNWYGFVKSGVSNLVSWPQINDLSENNWAILGTLKDTQIDYLQSNVPFAESMLSLMEINKMPRRIRLDEQVSNGVFEQQKLTKESFKLIFICVVLIMSCLLVEIIWSLFRLFKGSPTIVGLIICVSVSLYSESDLRADVSLNLLRKTTARLDVSGVSREVVGRTSIDDFKSEFLVSSNFESASMKQPWIWVNDVSLITTRSGELKKDVVVWIKRGGFLVIEQNLSQKILENLTVHLEQNEEVGWGAIPPDHELMRSYYLLDSLPLCSDQVWRGFVSDARLSILSIPYNYIDIVSGFDRASHCKNTLSRERLIKSFINILMIALATDYKKDQIHIPEILKRLR